MDTPNSRIAPWARALLLLMKGPIYPDQRSDWSLVGLYLNEVRNYLEKIGIELIFNETEGYAYLTQPDPEGEETTLPRLIRRRSLSWEVTLICVLLRQKLEEFDIKDTDSVKLFISRGELKDEIELFFPAGPNRTRLLEKLDSYIKNVKDLGYLNQIGKEDSNQPDRARYEVKRIIKARLTNDDLENILKKLKSKEDEPAASDVSGGN